MKAVILAAGEGRRLEPLTNLRPKPMIPVANKPLLEHVVEAVSAADIDEIVLVVGYKRKRIQDYFGDGNDWDVDIDYAIQRKQLGTGDAVLQAETHIDGDFLVLNGDRVIEPSVIEAVVEARAAAGETVMAVTAVDEPGLYGVIDIENGHVRDIREKPPAYAIESNLINAGVYAFGTDVFEAIRETEGHGELALTATLRERLDDSPVTAVTFDTPWLDVTRPWDLLTVNGRLLDREATGASPSATVHGSAVVAEATAVGDDTTVMPGAAVLRGTAVGDNVHVGANAVIRNSLVLSDVVIGAGTVLYDCVVGANARVGPNVTVGGGTADVVLEDEVHRGVRFGGMIGDNATVGAAASIAPGTLLGNDADVGGGSLVEGSVEPGSLVRRG